ncbi:MmgE/PrpD family protein [Bosea caraganae]|uniref:MmgE/PrpD family protein n=1 Tax=Bosea caraganae TaxID=2763117 RepID=A0A370KY79_9HYPH|nr:MmgE/PrpD family protein [Bosea caraganae]RDJ19928.1 MmgE/PrpD family protein [Bosea caraganae]RDJ23866.1 MmgE/PrpD family protein [Bosea caraganae]
MTIIESIARWGNETTAFAPLARERATHAILDTVGCILAGADDEATAMTAAFLDDRWQGPATAVGGKRATPGHAALVNGTAAHCLDFDDSFRPLMGHASAVLVPALLAVAEARGATGAQLIDAYLVGLEAQAVIGAGMNPRHYALGWHATSTIGAIGAAAGVARLLGLDAPGTARALSLAASMAAGPKGQFGTPAKPLHAGLAARNAVEAGLLAATGLTGRLDIVEHRFGLQALYGTEVENWQDILARIGAPHSIEAIGLTPKRHPCCASTHNTLDMILDLKAAHGFAAAEVAAVETLVGSINRNNLSYDAPVDEMQARFSMNYCVAVALEQGRLSIADFTPAAVARPAIRSLLPLTTMRAYAPEEEASSAYLPHKVTIRLKDGTVLRAERDMERGTLADPFDEADRRAKFMDCCAGYFDEARAGDLYDRLCAVEPQGSLVFLSQALLRSKPRPVRHAS